MPQGYDLTIEAPSDVRAGDVWQLEVRGGVLDQVGGGLCGVLRGRTVRAGEGGEWSEIAQPSGCVPVPEFEFGSALTVGVVWLVALVILGPALGRMLKRNGERYPAPDHESDHDNNSTG